jgi:hypothetical protein
MLGHSLVPLAWISAVLRLMRLIGPRALAPDWAWVGFELVSRRSRKKRMMLAFQFITFLL